MSAVCGLQHPVTTVNYWWFVIYAGCGIPLNNTNIVDLIVAWNEYVCKINKWHSLTKIGIVRFQRHGDPIIVCNEKNPDDKPTCIGVPGITGSALIYDSNFVIIVLAVALITFNARYPAITIRTVKLRTCLLKLGVFLILDTFSLSVEGVQHDQRYLAIFHCILKIY